VTFRRWDVIAVPFPFVEGYEAKRRPALVISTDDLHRMHLACFAAMITTARSLQDVRQGDVVVKDFRAAGLPAPCVIRVSRIATFQESAQIRSIGSIAAKERTAVAALLKRWLSA
jgi:mRNA interferase MazF